MTSYFVFFILTGCSASSQSAYEHFKAGKAWNNFPYQTGGTFSSLSRDTTNCQVYAVQTVPQQNVIKRTPSYTTNTNTSCNRIGSQTFCNTTGGQTIGGNIYTEDANSGLRNRVFYQCMADKKYRYVNLRPCPTGATLKTESNGLLPLSNQTCYRVKPDNSWVVGNY